MGKFRWLCMAVIAMNMLGCYGMRPSSGGGKATKLAEGAARIINPESIVLPYGYKIEAVVTGLTFPSGVTFDDEGIPYVVEAGYSYGEVWTTPRLLRVDNGQVSTIAEGGKNGPWTGVAHHKGEFFIAEGGELRGERFFGSVLTVRQPS